MSWTSIFPVLTEDMVTEYKQTARAVERAELETWLGVKRKINVKPSPHLVAVSVFWKNTRSSEPDLPPLTREILTSAPAHGLVKRYEPWGHYIQPVLKGAAALVESHPHVTVRIYLAADLDFLIEDFVAVGCEVYLMKHESLRHNPGAMWRFLAFSERNRLVTVTDSDRFAEVYTDIARTEQIKRLGQDFWRVPVCVDRNGGRVQYRPIMATQCGSAKSMPTVRTLMEALIWHTRRGSIRVTVESHGCAPQGIVGTDWPDYGFDEWFLQTALYPRLAGRPILTLVKAGSMSKYLPLDVEYVTWGHPESEFMYFGEETAGCCGPAPEGFGISKPRRAKSKGPVLLTGIWQVKHASDIALITELWEYSQSLDMPVALKPVLHLREPKLWSRVPKQVRDNAVVWEGLAYNVHMQDHLMSAMMHGHDAEWVWEADSDERVDFACAGGLKKVLGRADKSNADYVPGHWIDRVSPDGSMPSLVGGKFPEKFPSAVLATRFFQNSLNTKMALHRRSCPTRVGNHAPKDPQSVPSADIVPVWHFKWHSDCPENQGAKIDADKHVFWIWEFKQALERMTETPGKPSVDWSALPPEAWLVVRPEHRTGRYPVTMDMRGK